MDDGYGVRRCYSRAHLIEQVNNQGELRETALGLMFLEPVPQRTTRDVFHRDEAPTGPTSAITDSNDILVLQPC
ncbi:hypothetical protein BE17_37345 [Sorangium cellulosum]|uniref:Uncharacterized protein n=1 Tax=Sorangium cellulosum TaxID=56 RepID=A0A150RTX8_SORCE|nr:hypothetical protein BE17_37345 [Sorangium cellulosum]